MDKEYDIFDIEIGSISPIHIGCSDVYSQLDYVSKNNRVFILNFDKILEKVAEGSIDDLTNDILKNFDNNRWKGKVKDFFKKYGIDWKEFVDREYDLIGEIGKNEIHKFISSGEGAYIPGSSLKGAIKTAVFFSILKNNDEIRRNMIYNLKQNWRDKEIRKLISNNPFSDLFRAFQISDTQIIGDIKIAESKVYHFERKRFDTRIVYEVIDGFKTESKVKIDKKLLETRQLKKNNFHLTKENIVKACNDFSKDIIKYEIKKLSNVDDTKIVKIKEFYKNLEKEIENLQQNQCFLRIGQGSSSIATTMFLALKDNYEIKQKFIKRISRIKRKRYTTEFFPLTSKYILESKDTATKPLGWIILKWS